MALPPGASGITNIAVGDVNGDGRSDVVVIAAGSGFNTAGAFVYYANASGTLQAPVQVDSGTKLGPLVVGDLTGDGRADIALAENGADRITTGSLRIYLGKADGSFASPLVLNPAPYYTALAIGDMNKDGKQDLIVGNATAAFEAQVSVLLGNGDATFAAPLAYPLADGVGTTIPFLSVADFTFDGKPDVLVARDGEATEVLIGDGTGKFAVETALAIAGAATYAVADDLNGDTVMDAVVAVGQAGIVPLVRTQQVIGASTTPAPYTMTASSTSGSVSSGESVQTTLNFAFPAGFAETVSLACSGLPANATCSFAPASLVAAGGAATSVLTIQTGTQAIVGAASTAGPDPDVPLPLRSAALAAFLALLGATLHGALARRRRSPRSGAVLHFGRTRFSLRIGTLAAAGWLAGCDGGGDSSPAAMTPSGTYNVVVTASSPSGTQSVTYGLTVK